VGREQVEVAFQMGLVQTEDLPEAHQLLRLMVEVHQLLAVATELRSMEAAAVMEQIDTMRLLLIPGLDTDQVDMVG
jgi:hypothetical protein